MAGLSTMSSAQIVSASSLQNAGAHRMFGTPGITGNPIPMHTMLSPSEEGVNCNLLTVGKRLTFSVQGV